MDAIPTTEGSGASRRYTIMRRRQQVFARRLAGDTVREIAEAVGADTKTVLADLKALDNELVGSIDHDEAGRILAEKIRELRAVKEEAWGAALKVSGPAKVGLLNVFLSAVRQETALRQNAGQLDRDTVAPVQWQNPVQIYIPDNGRGDAPISATTAHT